MKMSRKILVITICVLLLLSISLVSFASSYKTFFRKKLYGYVFSGSASLSDHSGEATLTASMISGQPHIPPEDCSTMAEVTVFGREGEALGLTCAYGTTIANAKYEVDVEVFNSLCKFRYMSSDMGPYKFYD